MIDLYFWPTPNGWKISIALEEMGLPYNVIPLRIGQGEQFTEAFERISPSHRMPAIVDHEPLDGGDSFPLAESGMRIAETVPNGVNKTQRSAVRLVLLRHHNQSV